MTPYSPQIVTPQKRRIEKCLEKAKSVLASGGITKSDFYGTPKKVKFFSKRLSQGTWSPTKSPEVKKGDVYEFDENGETNQESPTLKSYEIGFLNPPGANACWLNATIQLLLGMKPLVDELERQVGRGNLSRSHYSQPLRSFLDVMKQRNKGRPSSVHRDMVLLKSALAALDSTFSHEYQHDAPEFLVRLIDFFRDDFSGNNYLDKKDLDSSPLKEINIGNQNASPTPSVSSENRQKSNPINDNVQFYMKECYSCTSCELQSNKSQEHLALYIDVPVKEEGTDLIPSIQEALEEYMQPHFRELRCEKCSGEQCRVSTKFSQLPRILLIQLKRYTFNIYYTEKITSSIIIPMEIDLKKFADENTVMPKSLSPSLQQQMSSFKNSDADFTTLDDDFEMSDDEEDNAFVYHLTGVLSHHGNNPNTGHYVADVYHHGPGSWYSYDDEDVEKVLLPLVLDVERSNGGYMFVYTHKPLHRQLQPKYRNPNVFV